MTGKTRIVLNQATVERAIQDYFTVKVFDASQLAKVESVTPASVYRDGKTTWEYEVIVDSEGTSTETEVQLETN